jgi:hypothetical protein
VREEDLLIVEITALTAEGANNEGVSELASLYNRELEPCSREVRTKSKNQVMRTSSSHRLSSSRSSSGPRWHVACVCLLLNCLIHILVDGHIISYLLSGYTATSNIPVRVYKKQVIIHPHARYDSTVTCFHSCFGAVQRGGQQMTDVYFDFGCSSLYIRVFQHIYSSTLC